MADVTLENLMSEDRVFPPSPEFVAAANAGPEIYEEAADSEAWWMKQALDRISWYQEPTIGLNSDDAPFYKWFEDGKLNLSYNCLDRHLDTIGDKIAYHWVGEPGDTRDITYSELHKEVSKFANALKSLGVEKGDRVAVYMGMVPELPITMLACARIGAVHSVCFGGFSSDSLADRIQDGAAKVLVTQDGSWRKGSIFPLKDHADVSVAASPTIEHVVVVERTKNEVSMTEGRDLWWQDLMEDQSEICEPEVMDAEDLLYILYTSGTTGKPKGIVHTQGGYLAGVMTTHSLVFDIKDDDVYWCGADIGWVTGHSYIVYGPLQNGATSIMFEGVPTYPEADRFWKVCDKYKVNQFYTAPTAIRALMAQGEQWPKGCDLSSLKVLGSVGEPINPEAWMWYHKNVGHEKCPIVDTWWQTETGGILITSLPGAWGTKPGSATLPFFGIKPAVLEPESGKELEGNGVDGVLAISEPWPGQMRTIYGDHQRFEDVYFSMYKGLYFTGDGCRRDEDGYYWITGRVDDVINVSGHRMGTAEVESALVSHPKVAEAAVVGFPHEIKGQGIYAYVTLMIGEEYTDELRKELGKHVPMEIGPIAAPDCIHWAPGLPKTRSGKIMRRILRKVAGHEADSIGDTSTLADPSVVADLIASDPRK